MTAYQSELVIDLGEVGFRNSKHPFRVRLESSPLRQLIEAAGNAHRVYELLLIDRPGDIWAYTSVVLDELPLGVASRVARARDEHTSRSERGAHAWPEGQMPFQDFDQLFYWAGDDTEPEDEAWLTYRNSSVMQAYAEQSLAIARAAQSRLDWNDHLLRHIVARIRAGKHPYCYLDRRVALAKCQESIPNESSHSPAFFKKLGELLRDGELASVAYRARGDYRVLHMMATEQRRRAGRTGHAAGNALHLSALVDYTIDNEAWDSEIWFFSEGLAPGDLFIEGGGLGATTVKELIEVHGRRLGNYILSARDEGEITGFDKEMGDRWVLYRKQPPYSRRRGLERIQDRQRSKLGPVLSFAEEGGTLFDFEKAVIVIGLEVTAPTRSMIAAAVAEWQGHGGNPMVIVCGAHTDFERAGCRDVLVPPEDILPAPSPEVWLLDVLSRRCPWIDAVLALQAPTWTMVALERHVSRQDGLWRPWIVATPEIQHLSADLTLNEDLEALFREASERAKSMRPRLL